MCWVEFRGVRGRTCAVPSDPLQLSCVLSCDLDSEAKVVRFITVGVIERQSVAETPTVGVLYSATVVWAHNRRRLTLIIFYCEPHRESEVGQLNPPLCRVDQDIVALDIAVEAF